MQYDLGGCTFDNSLLTIEKGTFKVRDLPVVLSNNGETSRWGREDQTRSQEDIGKPSYQPLLFESSRIIIRKISPPMLALSEISKPPVSVLNEPSPHLLKLLESL